MLIIVMTCVLFCAAGCVGGGGGAPEASSPPCGYMRVRVVDGMTEAPIAGAAVVLPETGGCWHTGADGMTERFAVPCVPDERHAALAETEEGRTTVIVNAEGFVPYLLLYARVLPGVERPTPTAYMFPDDGTLPVFEVIEAPPLDWAAEVVERYRP